MDSVTYLLMCSLKYPFPDPFTDPFPDPFTDPFMPELLNIPGMRQNSHLLNLVEMFCHMIHLESAIGDADPWKMSWTTSLRFLLLYLWIMNLLWLI